MAASSPSEFLTFYKTLGASHMFRHRFVSRAYIARPFASSVPKAIGEPRKDHKDNKHLLDRQDEPNVQSYESKKGMENKNQNTGGHATEQKDTSGSTAKAKKDFPEAPDVVIGMQDERGGKGH